MYKLSEPQSPIKVAITVLYSFVGIQLLLLLGLHHFTKIPFASFTADPAATYGYSPVYGYISNLGIMLWCACASVCLLSAAILNIRRDQKSNVAFLLNFGILTAILMFDDLFMFHESIAPWYLSIPEKVILAFYGMYALGCFYHFRRIIMGSDKRLLVLSVMALGMSIVLDQISSRYYIPGEYLFEDGLKFIGIASWLAYFLQYSFSQVMDIIIPSQFFDKSKMRTSEVNLVDWFRNN